MTDFMCLPVLSEDEFVENIDKDDFFRRFGNPALIHTKMGGALHRAERRIVRSNGRTVWASQHEGDD